MSDLIDRQAAIDAMINSRSNADVTLVPGSYTNGWRDGRKLLLDELLQVVFELPSVQPEPSQVARDIATIIENEKDMRVIASAQPERKKGEWIDYTEDGYVECPFCHSATNCDGNKDELHFCFSCGADMRGE